VGPTLLAGSERLPGGSGDGGAAAADQQPAAAAAADALRALDARVRKLGGQVKHLQIRFDLIAGGGAAASGTPNGGFQQRGTAPPDGDHAMLSSRPAVLGYR
jgi:hypothetical protein